MGMFVSLGELRASNVSLCPTEVYSALDQYVKTMNEGRYEMAAIDLENDSQGIEGCLMGNSPIDLVKIADETRIFSDSLESQYSEQSASSAGFFSFTIRICKSIPAPFGSQLRICWIK